MDSVRRFFTNDTIMLVLVLINTGIIFVSGFSSSQGGLILVIDSLFTLLFLLEAAIKIQVHGFSEYWSDGWNRFDFVIVLLALPSCVNVFGDIIPGTNVLLSLRMLRAFKSFRLLKFIPNIDSLLNGLRLAVKASYIVAIGLIVLLLVLALSPHSFSAVLPPSTLAIQPSACIPFSVCSPSKGGMICQKQLPIIVEQRWQSLRESISPSSFS